MQPLILYDHVMHGDHIHWCDLETNSMATCEAAAYREHAPVWAASGLSEVTKVIMVGIGWLLLAKALWTGREGFVAAAAYISENVAKEAPVNGFDLRHQTNVDIPIPQAHMHSESV